MEVNYSIVSHHNERLSLSWLLIILYFSLKNGVVVLPTS